MIRILFSYSSLQIHTGSPRVLMRLVEGLDRSRYAPFFLAPHDGDLCRELEARGATLVRGKTGSFGTSTLISSSVNILRLRNLLRRLRISLVHINELGWNSELAAAARLAGVPVVFHIHNRERLTLKNRNCRLGTRYLFVSRALARECGAHILGEKAEAVYNPITVGRFAAGRPVRADLGLPDGVPVVGTVAQIQRGKGIDTVVETAAAVVRELPATRFIIVGPVGKGEEAFAGEMKRRVSELGLRDNVIFCGPRHDIPDVLASIDVFFLPTRAEAFGMVIAEAMSARVPVVTTDVGGIPEIVPDESFGLTLPPESGNFPHAILTLLTRPELRNEMGARCYHRVKTLFSDRVFNDTIDRIYESILGKPGHHQRAANNGGTTADGTCRQTV